MFRMEQQSSLLLHGRTANLKYIERCYEGSIHCWNVAVLNDAALLSETNDPAMQLWLRRWLMLGLSLDPLLSKPAQEFLDAALSVLDQWSFQCTCKATEGREVNVLMGIRMKNTEWFGSRPSPLHSIHLPFVLDCKETIAVVCRTLLRVYSKIAELPEKPLQRMYEKVTRVDEHITSNFLRELCNAMMKSQRKVIAEQTAMVLSKT